MNLREYSNDGNDCLVVFIHGILSDGFNAWYESNERVFWPRMIINSPTLSDLDVISISYPTNIFLTDYGPNEICSELKVRFDNLVLFKREKIIFVCHSLGGIIARRFIVKYSNEFIQKEIILGLYLIASPTNGSGYASLLSIPIRIIAFEQGDILRKNSSFLKSLHSDFTTLIGNDEFHLIGREIIEHKFLYTIPLIKPIVQRYSGVNYFEDPLLIPKTNHCTINTPISKNDTQHQCLIELIHRALNYEWRNQKKIDANLRRSSLINSIQNELIPILKKLKLDSIHDISFNDSDHIDLFQDYSKANTKISRILSFINPNSKLYEAIFQLLEYLKFMHLFCVSKNQLERDKYLLKIDFALSFENVDFNELRIDFNRTSDPAENSLFFLNWNNLITHLCEECEKCIEKTAESQEIIFAR